MSDDSNKTSRSMLLVIGTALLLLAGASLLPWSELTGGTVKDFNLLGDLFPAASSSQHATGGSQIADLDPGLAELEQEPDAETDAGNAGSGPATPSAGADSARSDTVAWIPPHTEAPRIDGHVVVENYTGEPTLARFSAALSEAGERLVRVAFIGDSYIEGDIFSQDVRRLLQEEYGGRGAGYLCIHSELPGFRNSVRQSSSGWDLRNILNMGRTDTIHIVTGEYAISRDGATAQFRGNADIPSLARWDRSRAVFLTSDTASVTLETDSTSRTFTLLPSSRPQTVELEGTTSLMRVKNLTPGVTSLGVYLDGLTGVAVDCISNRGSAGLNLRQARAATSRAVDYDLIILEFGINAISEQQTNYNSYGIAMRHVIERMKELFPNADILMLGIADRGAKINGTVRSLPVCNAMTEAQRKAASHTRVHFYDLRAAQGGENAIVSWRERGLVNADYIHLNHKGGKVLAQELIEGLRLSMSAGTDASASPPGASSNLSDSEQ